ncbi:MAG: acyl-CoA reductase [Chloroflexota bacterium]
METLCRQNRLLTEERGVVRAPFLVKGQLILPPQMTRAEIESAFASAAPETRYLKLPRAQLLREPVIDRAAADYSADFLYQVLPPLDPLDLIETDIEKLVAGPYALSVNQVADFTQTICETLARNALTLDRVRGYCRLTMDHPAPFIDGAFAALQTAFNREGALAMMDNELSAWRRPGRDFLDGWVDLPSQPLPGLTPLLARALPSASLAPEFSPGATSIRAMPTRQLHITAGNAPEVPLVSALRLILSKSVGAVKLPFGVTLPGALLALAAYVAAPTHPLTQNLSIVYWQGGDEGVENILFTPGAFDRIVVWGAPEAVTSVHARAAFTKVVSFNPRYGVSLIGREAFANNLDEVAFAAAMDTMIYSQKACAASQVHYVEGDEEQARAYGQRVSGFLREWDAAAPAFVAPAQRGQWKRLRRGKYARAEWLVNEKDGRPVSSVIVMPDEFDILDHPMCRLVVVRRVDRLEDALRYLHQGVSTAGVYPEARRLALRDAIAARGVSNILPLGQCERVFSGAPHDGMLVLSELVDWKNA